jgi:ubiquitin fusion degradation protein 1
MMQTLGLDVGDMIQVKTTSLELARLVKLQPQSVRFLDITDPRSVLEKAFRNFAALTKGDLFTFEYLDEIYEVKVVDVKPQTEKMGVSMIETDVSVEFEAPVGYVEPERQPRGSGTSTPRSTGPAAHGVPPGGLLRSQGTMAQAINYAAIAPGAQTESAGNFVGEGHRLSSAKKGAKASEKSTTTTPTVVLPKASVPKGRNGAPAPLRLPPNKLFLGYPIVPLKTAEDKAKEAENAKQPHFAGRGQTLRDLKKKDDSGK